MKQRVIKLVAKRYEVTAILDLGSSYDRRIICGISEFMRRKKLEWSLRITSTFDDQDARASEQGCDGIIAKLEDKKIIRRLQHLAVPIVGIGGGEGFSRNHLRTARVYGDDNAVARMGAKYLLSLGFRRFGFCNETAPKSKVWAKERAAAFAGVIQEAGFHCDFFSSKCDPAKQWREYQCELRDWLAKLEVPIAIMACNDRRARHVLQACRTNGLRVPDDIAVLGIDDDDLMCELTRPPLSSVRQGDFQIGMQSAAILDRMMNKGVFSPRLLVQPEEVVVRQSTDITTLADPDVAAALAFIRRNVCDRIRVRDVLEMSSVSRSTLDDKFRELVGRTIHAEIRRVRIQTAQRLLVTTNMSIKAVARRSGFSTVQFFCSVIRKATGLSPSEFRQRTIV